MLKLPALGPELLGLWDRRGPGSRGCPVHEGQWFTRKSGEGLQGWGMGVCVTLSRPSSSAWICTVALNRGSREAEGGQWWAESWECGQRDRWPGAP